MERRMVNQLANARLDGNVTIPFAIAQGDRGLNALGAIRERIAANPSSRLFSGLNLANRIGDASSRFRFATDPATSGLARNNGIDPRLYSKFVYPNGYPALSAAPLYQYGSMSAPYQGLYPDPYAFPYLTAYPYPYGPGYGYVSTAPLSTVLATAPMPLRAARPTDGWVCFRY